MQQLAQLLFIMKLRDNYTPPLIPLRHSDKQSFTEHTHSTYMKIVLYFSEMYKRRRTHHKFKADIAQTSPKISRKAGKILLFSGKAQMPSSPSILFSFFSLT